MDGNEPAYGGPATTNSMMMFVELQNLTRASGGSVKIYFDALGLNCDLGDSVGRVVPKPDGGVWGGRGPFKYWVVLPYNSTIRLFVNSGNKSPLRIPQRGEPGVYWSFPLSDTNVYYLSGTLTVSTPTNGTLSVSPPESMGYHSYHDWRGTLNFPKAKISLNR